MAQNLVRPGTNVVRVRAPGTYLLDLIKFASNLNLINFVVHLNLVLIHKIHNFSSSRNYSRPTDQGSRHRWPDHKGYDCRRPEPARHVRHSSVGSGGSCHLKDQHAGHSDYTDNI
jgi:hypothetical protein